MFNSSIFAHIIEKDAEHGKSMGIFFFLAQCRSDLPFEVTMLGSVVH